MAWGVADAQLPRGLSPRPCPPLGVWSQSLPSLDALPHLANTPTFWTIFRIPSLMGCGRQDPGKVELEAPQCTAMFSKAWSLRLSRWHLGDKQNMPQRTENSV